MVGKMSPSRKRADDEDSVSSFGIGPDVPAKPLTKLAWTGDCAVDHEAFQRMVEEHRQAKKQQALLELKTKQLAAQLARTEEAAKRALLRTDTSAKGGAAQRLLDAERLAQKLKEENADLASKLSKEKKRCIDFKARSAELEARLTAALKEQRRLVARLGAEERGNVSSIRKRTEEQHWNEEAGRRFRDQQEMLVALKEENESLRARLAGEGGDEVSHLQGEVDELRRQLEYFQHRAGAPQSKGATMAAAADAPIGPDDWVLEEVEHDGQGYVFDRETSKLFTTTGAGQWPRPAGFKTKDGLYTIASYSMLARLLDSLDGYLKDNRQRLSEVFASFDRDGSGALDRRELSAMLRTLMPDMSGSESEALRQLLDVDGDGTVTQDELIATIKDLMAASDAAKRGKSVDINGVLQRVRTALRERRKEATASFDMLDTNHDQYLSFAEVAELARKLVPGLTAKELRYLLIKLHFWDVKGQASTQLHDLYACLELLSVRLVPPPGKPMATTSTFSTGGGYIPAGRAVSPVRTSTVESEYGSPAGGYKAPGSGMQEMYLKDRVAQLQADLAEARKKEANLAGDATQVPTLRSELAKAQARVQQLEMDFLLFDPARLPEMSDYDAQMKLIRNQLLAFKRRYMEDHAELNSIKSAHDRAVKALDASTKEKLEESRARFAMEDELVGLRATAQRIADIELRLQKEREEKAALHREMLELQARALRAPSSALEQVRLLQRQLAELEGKKADAEAREAEWRGKVGRLEVQLSQVSLERLTSVERELMQAKTELARKQTRIEEMENRLQVFSRIKDASTIPLDLKMPTFEMPMPSPSKATEASRKPAESSTYRTLPGSAKPDADKSEAEMRAELAQLREAYNADLHELDKLRKVLQHEEDIANEAHAALEELRHQKDEEAEELKQELASLRRELDRRDERIHKLELQLRGAYTGITKAVRSSMARMSYATEEPNDLTELAPHENIFELILDEVTLKEQEVGADVATFFTVDFYLHETQATQVVGGLHPKFDTTIQYIVTISEEDTFFLEYMDNHVLELELHAAEGWDYRQIGLARIRLRTLLEDVELGARVGHPQFHHAEVFGGSGRAIGSVRFGVAFRKPLERALRHYRTLVRSQAPLALDPRDPIVEAVKKAESSSSISSYIRVQIEQANRLQHADGARVVSPYIYYRFPGHAEPRNTVVGLGSDPEFGDEALLAMARTREAEAAFGRRELSLLVWDDAAGEDAQRSLVGIANVPLAPLSTGLHVYDHFRVIHPGSNKFCGTVLVSISWYNPLQAASGASSMPVPLPLDSASPASSVVLKETTPQRGRPDRAGTPTRFRAQAEASDYERMQREREAEEAQVQQQGRDLQRRMDARPQPASPAPTTRSPGPTTTTFEAGARQQDGRVRYEQTAADEYGLGQHLSHKERDPDPTRSPRGRQRPDERQEYGLGAEERSTTGTQQRPASGHQQGIPQQARREQDEFGLGAEEPSSAGRQQPPVTGRQQGTPPQQPREPQEFGLGAEDVSSAGRQQRPASGRQLGGAAQPSREQEQFGLGAEESGSGGRRQRPDSGRAQGGTPVRQPQFGLLEEEVKRDPRSPEQEPSFGLSTSFDEPQATETPMRKEEPRRGQAASARVPAQQGAGADRGGPFSRSEERGTGAPAHSIKLLSGSSGSARSRYSDVVDSQELALAVPNPQRISANHADWVEYEQQLIIRVDELQLARSERGDPGSRVFVIEHNFAQITAEAALQSPQELRRTDPVPHRSGTINIDQAFAYRVMKGSQEATSFGAALKRHLSTAPERDCVITIRLLSGSTADTRGLRFLGEASLDLLQFWEGQGRGSNAEVELLDSNGTPVGRVTLTLALDAGLDSLKRSQH